MPEILSKLLRAALWSHLNWLCRLIGIWADIHVFDRLDRQFRSAAPPRIRSGICGFVLCYSETNKRLKDWAKRWELPWSVACSSNIKEISFSQEKSKSSSQPKILQRIKLFSFNLSRYRKSGSTSSWSEPVAAKGSGLKLELCSLTNEYSNGFIYLETQNNLFGVWVLFRSIEDAKDETVASIFQRLSPRLILP